MLKLPLSSQSWKSCTACALPCSALSTLSRLHSSACTTNAIHDAPRGRNVIKDELAFLQIFREQCEKAGHYAAGACTPCCCPSTPPGGVLEASIVPCCHRLTAVWLLDEALCWSTRKGPTSPKASFSLTWPDTSRLGGCPAIVL